jgi:hypothetical protein
VRKKSSINLGKVDFVPAADWDDDTCRLFAQNAPLIYPWRLPADDEYVIELKRRGLPLNQTYFAVEKRRR